MLAYPEKGHYNVPELIRKFPRNNLLVGITKNSDSTHTNEVSIGVR